MYPHVRRKDLAAEAMASSASPIEAGPHDAAVHGACGDAACLFDMANSVTSGPDEPCLDVDERHAYVAALSRSMAWLVMQRTQRACCEILNTCSACVSQVQAERLAACMFGEDLLHIR